MATPSLWQSKNASLKIATGITIASGTALWDSMIAATDDLSFETVATDVEFTEPENTTDTIQLLGSTSGSQNSIIVRNPPEDAEFTATLLLNPEGGNTFNLEQFKLQSTAETATDATTANAVDFRYNYGNDAPAADVAVAIRFESGTKFVVFLMNKCVVETLGGVTIDAEGHATQEVTIKAA